MGKALMVIGGRSVTLLNNGGVRFHAGMTIDADGSPRCYHPQPGKGLDYLANAGYPGNWWALVTDTGRRDGTPVIQGIADPAPGYYVSATAYEIDGIIRTNPKRYLDSEKVRFVVVPGPLRMKVRGVVLGCRATVTRPSNGASVEAVVGDIGPSTHLGEASIAAARALGIPSSPKTGGVVSGLVYTIYPGEAALGFELKPA